MGLYRLNGLTLSQVCQDLRSKNGMGYIEVRLERIHQI